MLHPDDLPEGTEAGELVVRRYTVEVLVPRSREGAPAAASLAGWFDYDRERSLALDVTGMGQVGDAMVCAEGRHVVKDSEATPGDCNYCMGEAERAYERRMEGGA